MIELADFVSQSLVQIANGILKANEQLRDTNGQVNPAGVSWPNQPDARIGVLNHLADPTVQRVEFDVAVIASEATQTKGGIGVAVAVVGLGSAGQSDQSKKSESRIRFSVPMLLPYEPNKQPHGKSRKNREGVMPKCSECGYLGLRLVETRALVDADEAFRKRGAIAGGLGNHGADPRCDRFPTCFARKRQFLAELGPGPNEGQRLLAIEREIDCDSFVEWQPGVSPQELANMVYQEKLLNEQRAWQAEQSQLADDRHQDNLRELAKATAWNWRGVLLAAGIGAIATLLAGALGALATLLVLLGRAA